MTTTELGNEWHGVFEAFPFGLVLADQSGRLLKANPRGSVVLEESAALQGRPRASMPATCCEALCDRAPKHVMQASCLTELALQSPGRAPELRLDLGTTEHPAAAWVGAFKVDRSHPMVVFQLRPGAAFDRRRIAGSDLSRFPALRVRALGTFEVDGPQGPIEGDWFGQRPGMLLKYLVSERALAVPREQIAEALVGTDHREPLGSVRQYVRQLRLYLEPGRPARGPSLYVVTRKGGYALEGIWIDVDEFEHRVKLGLHALRRGREVGARNWLEQARRLYRGDFLAEDADAEWARPERNRLRELAAEMLRALTDLELRHGDLGAASVHARQLSQMLPLDSDVHETFLRICLEMGRHSEAARGHEIFRHRLLRHFGREPGFTLAELTAGSAHPSEPGPVARARTSWR